VRGRKDGGARDHQGDPVEVCAEEMHYLEPGGCEQKHVGCAQQDLYADKAYEQLA